MTIPVAIAKRGVSSPAAWPAATIAMTAIKPMTTVDRIKFETPDGDVGLGSLGSDISETNARAKNVTPVAFFKQ